MKSLSEGNLYYIPFEEIQRIVTHIVAKEDRAELLAMLCRVNALYMIAKAGSGHIGSSFSSMEIISWLYLCELEAGKDIFFSSKGHDAPALYSVLLALGKLPFEQIHCFRRFGGLPGHPDVATPAIVTNTGSLGMGVSKAKGMIVANRLRNTPGRVFVLTGDGELQEGQIWESLLSAANNCFSELTVIVDHNKIQSDTFVSAISDLGDLEAKFKAFGWHVERCNGNAVHELAEALSRTKKSVKPSVIIADTVKGYGVRMMEHTSIDAEVEFYKFHSGAPSHDVYIQAVQELFDCVARLLERHNLPGLHWASVAAPVFASFQSPQRLIPAYAEALLEAGRRDKRIIALDADLQSDTGVLPFKKDFPERFVECGIAEQDMVSQAGGMALQGMIPIVHSFACFLSSRANEQIYNNASEKTKIIYVGSLAGVLPGGPGHSHQGVRDLASLSGIPGLTLVEPSCEKEVGLLLNWSLEAPGSVYMRLHSLPCEIPFSLPADYSPQKGQGVVLREGTDAIVFAYGPLNLSTTMRVADKLFAEHGLSAKVVNMPWLNSIDEQWLSEITQKCCPVIVVDNHYVQGGLGERLAATLMTLGTARPGIVRLGLEHFPPCGSSVEVLAECALDEKSIYRQVITALSVAGGAVR